MQAVEYKPLTNQLYRLATLKHYKSQTNTELAIKKCHTVYFGAQKGDVNAIVTLVEWHESIKEIKQTLQAMRKNFEPYLSKVGVIKVEPIDKPLTFSANCKLAGEYIQLLIAYDVIMHQINAMYVFGYFTREQYFEKTSALGKMLNRITSQFCQHNLNNAITADKEKLTEALSSEYLPLLNKETERNLQSIVATH